MLSPADAYLLTPYLLTQAKYPLAGKQRGPRGRQMTA
jgi:hypothetical protein